ncbi:MAG TPA: hypothetical protein VN924_25000 [Bryobacteraceae bacterium]|nr:hypothetical protein [Bryobacteraceae bacterium]
MRMIRLAGMMALFSLAAFGQSQVYLDQFSLLREKADSPFKELSERDLAKLGEIARTKNDSATEFLNLLYEPMNRLLPLSGSVLTLQQKIQKSWNDGYGKKVPGAGEMNRFRYLIYACSSLSLMLDALQDVVLYFGGDRNWLDLATFQKLAINSALKFLGQVKP